jgi:cytoskeletal protein RodZ
MLRNARERKGLDITTAARKLRIRPDILRAIESADFARMPPRGYTSNMVTAYARMLGLNPNEITRMYRDEMYQYETGRRPMGEYSDRSTRTRERSSSYNDHSSSHRTSRSSQGAGASRRYQAPAQPAYSNLVQGRQAPGILSNVAGYLPIIVVSAIILILLFLVINLAFCSRTDTQTGDTPVVPVSGMPSSSSSSDTSSDTASADTPTTTTVAPTSAKFTYTVADGKSVYIEVIEDGKTTLSGDFTGPKTGSYDVTTTLKFVFTGDEGDVTLTVDGEQVTPTDQNGKGVYSYTVDFESILETWKKENNVTSSSSDSSSGSTSDSSSSESSSSTGSSDASSSSDSSSSSGDSSSSSSSSDDSSSSSSN